MHAREQAADRRVAVAVALEMPDHHLAVGKRARQAVLHAELGIEGALRVGPVGMFEPALVGPRIDALDLLRL